MAIPSIPRLREVFAYDPISGILTWRISPRYGISVGDIAGTDNGNGYLNVKIDQIQCSVHRIAWAIHFGKWPDGQIDHKFGKEAGNGISNLRDVTQSVNMQNQRKPNRRGTSGFLGVSYCKNTRAINKWMATIFVNGRLKYLGRFETPEIAHSAYVEAKRKLHPGGLL